LWLPPGTQPPEDALVALIRDSVPARDQDALFAVFEQMGQCHPREPHWYLPLIGTDPGQQSKGYGSALLSYALAICDQEKMPAYLEATSPRNVRYISGMDLRCLALSRPAPHRQSPRCFAKRA
jgi:GNAT superfamily N-acetyltransferase